jgi:hypothetical protein
MVWIKKRHIRVVLFPSFAVKGQDDKQWNRICNKEGRHNYILVCPMLSASRRAWRALIIAAYPCNLSRILMTLVNLVTQNSRLTQDEASK